MMGIRWMGKVKHKNVKSKKPWEEGRLQIQAQQEGFLHSPSNKKVSTICKAVNIAPSSMLTSR